MPERGMHVGTYWIYYVETVDTTPVLDEDEARWHSLTGNAYDRIDTFATPLRDEEPSVKAEEHGVRVTESNGCWRFYPWAAIRSFHFQPAGDD